MYIHICIIIHIYIHTCISPSPSPSLPRSLSLSLSLFLRLRKNCRQAEMAILTVGQTFQWPRVKTGRMAQCTSSWSTQMREICSRL